MKQQMIEKADEQRDSHTAQPMDWAEIETLVLMEQSRVQIDMGTDVEGK